VHKHLHGVWRTDLRDTAAVDRFGLVRLEFKADGELLYAVEGNNGEQIACLTYRVDGDHLITDQPSAPAEQRTKYCLLSDGRLRLEYGQFPAHYVRKR